VSARLPGRWLGASLGCLLLSAGCAGTPEAPPVVPSDADRLLAASCSGCHGSAAGQGGLPRLDGLTAAELAEALRAFRAGRREATLMNRLAAGYSDDEIDRLARVIGRP